MGTSAPVRKVYDVPLPKRKEGPKRLPAPDPERYVSPMVVPERERVRKV